MQIKENIIKNKILKKILIIAIIAATLFCYIPFYSFAEDDTDGEVKYPAIVPAYADAIISKFVSTTISSGNGSSANGDAITDYSETGDGWDSITTVNYPNGVTRTFRNYKQYQGSYAGNSYWGGTISANACGPSSIAIILSGYGIDADPGKVVDAFHELGYDYSSMSILQTVLKEKYNIDSQMESLTTSSIQHIRDNFNAGRPVITGVPNHFITYLGEDSNGKIILSDPGYSDRTYGDTIEDYVSIYGNRGFDLLLIKSDGNATSNGSNNKSNSGKSSNNGSNTSNPSGSGQASTQACDVSNGGYDKIFTSGTTGRQFKEFKQNANYNYPSVTGTYWGQECSTVATGIVGSGYKNLTMQDMADKLNQNGGLTYVDGFISDFTGQSIQASSVSSIDEFKNALSNGSVAVFHDWGYSARGHYLAILDISSDKSQVYVSNPDVYANGWDGMSEGWLSTDFVYGALDKGELYFATNDGSAVDYSGEGTATANFSEDKIFFIGDSWMVGLNASGKARSSSDYFYAQGGRNADWVLNTYSNMKIPSDASCIVVEFGLNGLTNWDKTKELINKLANDYPDKKIFVLQTPHICDGYTVDPSFNSKVDTYNSKMKDFCSGNNQIIFIDPTINIVSDNGRGYLKNKYALAPNDTSMGGGKIHLNNDGYEVWYNDIIACIKNNLPQGGSTQSVNMSSRIIENGRGGYKIDINLDEEIDNLLVQLEDKGFHLENYLSTRNQKKYMKNMIKAAIVTQYPDLRSADEIANNTEIPSDETQGCIKVKRYSDDETKAYASGALSNPVDTNDEDKGMYLAYKPYDEFKELINDEDKDALNYFSMDTSNNIVVAGWETMQVEVDGPNQTNIDEVGAAPSNYQVSYTPKQTPYSKLTMKSMAYLNQVSNYTMPFNLLWSLLVYGHNDKFINDLAELVISTKIVIGCFDATNIRVTTYEEEYTVEGIAYTTINLDDPTDQTPHATTESELTPVTVEYHFVVTETDTLKTDTPTIKVIFADTWAAVYNNNYRIKTETQNADEQTTELDDQTLDSDWFIRRGERYTGGREPDNEALEDKIDETIEEETDKILDQRISELQAEADEKNRAIEYKYEALQAKIEEYFGSTALAQFLLVKDVQSNVINMITNQYSREQVAQVFSDENDLMVKYAKDYGNYNQILQSATNGVYERLIPDQDLYNEITKDGTDFTQAVTYTTNIESILIETEKIQTDRTNTINEEQTTATVEEVPSDDNLRWKTSKSLFAENSFVKILYYNPEAKTNLLTISGWFFESMEKTASIADLEDLMKYLFQCVYNLDYGITEERADELLKMFDPEEMEKFHATTTSHGTIVGGASYSSLTLTDDDMTILYKLVEAEGGGGTHEQVMYIACTILNRVLSSSFPNSISEVAFASGQFEVTWNGMYDAAVPSQATKDAVDDAIRTGDTTGGSIGFQNDWLYDSQYPSQTWETPIELLRETWPYGGVVVFFTTASIQAELSQY